MAADIAGISSMATRQILMDLSGAYQKRTGRSVAIESVGGVDAASRVRSGERFDIIILADGVMRQLESDGCLQPGSRAGFAESTVAVAARSGAKRPSLTDEAATKAAILAAQTICYSTGPSGLHVIKLLKKWGIEELMAGKIIEAPPGVPVGTIVARGEAELGFQQLSELMDLPGIEIAGPLPDEIQSVTVFSCGVGARASNGEGARDLIAYLTSSDAERTIRRHGMEPARAAS